MEHIIKILVDRYKHIRSIRQLKCVSKSKYAFVGIGSHSSNNLYPVLSYLHVPLKYICCNSQDKLKMIEAAYPGVHATTSLDEILQDEEVKGVFVSVSPKAHFSIASKVIKSGKALFVEKPPCQSLEELLQLIKIRREAGFPIVTVGLQKRSAPTIRILKKKLRKTGGEMSYNLRYLTGAYPEGEALLELFIHPLDYVTFLFGESEVKCVEQIGGHTLLIMLRHAKASGILELSTGYSWNDAIENLVVNTHKGVYEMMQMDRLTFKTKQAVLMGVPLEKLHPCKVTSVDLFNRNNYVPTLQNNQVVTQGYFDTVRNFVCSVEGQANHAVQNLEELTDTYLLMETIRSQIKKRQ